MIGGLSINTDITPMGEFLAQDGLSHGEVEDFAPIPEPTTAILFALASIFGAGCRRRRSRTNLKAVRHE